MVVSFSSMLCLNQIAPASGSKSHRQNLIFYSKSSNTVPVDDKCPCSKRNNLPLPLQIQLDKKRRAVRRFLLYFYNLHEIISISFFKKSIFDIIDFEGRGYVNA